MAEKDGVLCPCGTGDAFVRCCAPALSGDRPAPTAEALMRSRYTAFALGDDDYIAASWAPETRQSQRGDEARAEWLKLTVLNATHVLGADEAGVEFVAQYRQDGVRSRLHERSRFVRRGGRWLYLDGEFVS